MIKKANVIILTLIALIFTLSGCKNDGPDFPGKDKIQSAVDRAAGYTSGRYVITNLQNGNVEEVFSFMFDEKERQIWLDETETLEDGNTKTGFRYYDGEFMTDETGKTTARTYTKDEPFDMSTGSLLFYIPALIEYGTENYDTGMGEGFVMYEQVYNNEKLQKNSDSFENIESFTTTYLFENDTFVAMTEHIKYKNGAAFDYQVEIIDINNVKSIEKPR
jgi:outer membrane lipoprotein-sorting protein